MRKPVTLLALVLCAFLMNVVDAKSEDLNSKDLKADSYKAWTDSFLSNECAQPATSVRGLAAFNKFMDLIKKHDQYGSRCADSSVRPGDMSVQSCEQLIIKARQAADEYYSAKKGTAVKDQSITCPNRNQLFSSGFVAPKAVQKASSTIVSAPQGSQKAAVASLSAGKSAWRADVAARVEQKRKATGGRN